MIFQIQIKNTFIVKRCFLRKAHSHEDTGLKIERINNRLSDTKTRFNGNIMQISGYSPTQFQV